MQSLEIQHRVDSYISRNLSSFESESTINTLKACNSQKEKILLRR